MTSIDQLREMLRSGAYDTTPKPEPIAKTPSNPSHIEAAPEPTPGVEVGIAKEKRVRMVKLSMLGKPDKKQGGKRFTKVYILELFEKPSPTGHDGFRKQYTLKASWGRVGNTLMSNELEQLFFLDRAREAFKAKRAEKIKKGYNIDDEEGKHL